MILPSYAVRDSLAPDMNAETESKAQSIHEVNRLLEGIAHSTLLGQLATCRPRFCFIY